jgi:hypothetical protein
MQPDRAATVRIEIEREIRRSLSRELFDLIESMVREALVERELDVRHEYSADQ